MSDSSKKKALINVVMSIAQVSLASLFAVYLTSMLVRRLGVEYYGFVPLFGSVGMYLGLLTILFTSSIGRFTALSYYKGDVDEANSYFTSGFVALLGLGVLGFIVVVAASFFLEVFFSIPQGGLGQVKAYFILLSFGILITSVSSAFNVSAYIKHSFFLSDVVLIVRRFIQIAIIVYMLQRLSLTLVGASNFLVACLGFAMTYAVSRKLMPELRVDLKLFKLSHCKQMAQMGIAVLLNQLGGILYFQSSVLVVNVILGASEAGRFGIVFQVMIIIKMLSMIVVKLFGPILVEQVSKEQFDVVKYYLHRFTKLIAIGNGLFVALLCGFAHPILYLWVGQEFVNLQPLLVLMAMATVFMYSLGLVFNALKALNKIKVPSVVTMLMGVINIVLSVVLVKYTRLGIYGAAVSVLFCVLIKAVLFNVIYLGRMIKMSPFKIWGALFWGLIPCVVFSLISYAICSFYNIDSFMKLIVSGGIVGSLYCLVSFYFFINSKDRRLLLEILKMDRILGSKLFNLVAQ